MIFSDAVKLGMIDRMGVREEGNTADMGLTFWSGPVPTLAQFNQANDDLLLKFSSDSKKGRVITNSLREWLESLGCQELATAYFGSDSSYFTVLDKNNVIFDVSTTTTDFDVKNEGIASMFTAISLHTNGTTSSFLTSSHDTYHLLMGSVGLPGSGADQEISDVEINSTKTIKPGTIKISI
jgi:hypothetical protein